MGDQNLVKDNDGAEPITVEALKFIGYPKYKSSLKYFDVALLELKSPVKFTSFIRPACLWQGGNAEDRNVTATGWGHLEHGGSASEELMKVYLTSMKNSDCKPYYTTYQKYVRSLPSGIIDSQMCAGNIVNGEILKGKDTCQGDSGGPLQVTNTINACIHYVVGVTSFSIGCAAANSPGKCHYAFFYLVPF